MDIDTKMDDTSRKYPSCKLALVVSSGAGLHYSN